MKASGAILVLFSGLAVASPLINARENIDDAKAALGDLQTFVEKSKASTEESLKNQADRQAVWTGRVNQEQDLIQKLVDLHKESVQAAADAPARLEAQGKRRREKNQALEDIANRLGEALQ